jgi:hypothetical protein
VPLRCAADSAVRYNGPYGREATAARPFINRRPIRGVSGRDGLGIVVQRGPVVLEWRGIVLRRRDVSPVGTQGVSDGREPVQSAADTGIRASRMAELDASKESRLLCPARRRDCQFGVLGLRRVEMAILGKLTLATTNLLRHPRLSAFVASRLRPSLN